MCVYRRYEPGQQAAHLVGESEHDRSVLAYMHLRMFYKTMYAPLVGTDAYTYIYTLSYSHVYIHAYTPTLYTYTHIYIHTYTYAIHLLIYTYREACCS